MAKLPLNVAAVETETEKEVQHGWELLFAIDLVRPINNPGLVPLGSFEKFSINEEGDSYTKIRVTHNCSFRGPLGMSVNNRVLRKNPTTVLLRILPPLHNPHDGSDAPKFFIKRILIGKIDLDAAYQKIHSNSQIASTCIVIVVNFDFLCLKLTFGTSSAPEEYNTIIEVEIYLVNDLIMDI